MTVNIKDMMPVMRSPLTKEKSLVEQLQEQTRKREQAQARTQKKERPPPQTHLESPSIWKELSALGIKIAVIAIAFGAIFTLVYGFHRNTDPDMAPMVKTGDLVMFYRLHKDYAIGDLLLLDFQGERQVRRVVAKAGDTVDFADGYLIINGAAQQESEIHEETWQYESGMRFPLTVGEDQVFVLGDARENATDSRVYGPVDTRDTLGSVITIIRRRNL